MNSKIAAVLRLGVRRCHPLPDQRGVLQTGFARVEMRREDERPAGPRLDGLWLVLIVGDEVPLGQVFEECALV
ncbi:hypothetical protein [Candidatus Amarobacter glycogenicus]|uniref:hypothetical protein n=1 Tax=Candidatus Amarobacter glycogenicus TaxID=3140699 RepID=UPI0031CCCF19